jgi:hypothetical protein
MTVATRHHYLQATMPVLLAAWGVAALLVVAAHRFLDPLSAPICVIAKVCAIVAVSFGYMRLAARRVTLDHALFAGASWLVLAIVAEVIVTMRQHHGWFQLVGSPTSATRNLLMFAWVFGPALFARGRASES